MPRTIQDVEDLLRSITPPCDINRPGSIWQRRAPRPGQLCDQPADYSLLVHGCDNTHGEPGHPHYVPALWCEAHLRQAVDGWVAFFKNGSTFHCAACKQDSTETVHVLRDITPLN